MSEPASPPLHVERVPLRWSDMDSLGHVNNAVYFTYCESARMGLFDRLKLADYAGDLGPVVVTASCTFKQQLTFPATLAIEVRCSKVGRTSFTLTYDLRRLTADGDPDEKAKGDGYPCQDPVCRPGQVIAVFVPWDGQGEVFPVGRGLTFEARAHGTLSFRINDSTYQDNHFFEKDQLPEFLLVEIKPADM